MPQTKAVHIDAALTQVSVGYRNTGYIADQVMPEVPVDKQSDYYWEFGQDMFDLVDDRVRPGGVANEIDWDLSKETYYANGHALREAIPDRLDQNADPGIEVLTTTTENVVDRLDLNREKRVADLTFSSGTYAVGLKTTLAGATQWSHTDSKPIDAVKAAAEAVAAKIGREPNTLVVGKAVLDKLVAHAKLIDLVKYAQVGILTDELLMRLLGVPKILVGTALYNTARKGQSRSLARIWGKHAALLYIPERPAQKTPAFGYSFVWTAPGSQKGRVVYNYRNEDRHSTMIEAERYEDHKVVCQAAGYFFENAVA